MIHYQSMTLALEPCQDCGSGKHQSCSPKKKTNNFPDDGIPVIRCDPAANGELCAFWCPYCRREHWHAADEGSRVAQCQNKQSPFHKTGYYLFLRPARQKGRRKPKVAFLARTTEELVAEGLIAPWTKPRLKRSRERK